MRASICVDTAKKRNGGVWVDITQYNSLKEFLKVCKRIHEDESEPEFLFTDFAGMATKFHHTWLNEYTVDKKVFDFIRIFKNEDYKDKLAFLSFITTTEHYDYPFEKLMEFHENRYLGDFGTDRDADEDFARFMLEEKIESLLPSDLLYCFDYKKWAESEFINSYIMDKHGNVWSKK